MRISTKRQIAMRLGITPEEFAAYQRHEAAKRKALKSMTAAERRAFLEAEAEHQKRRAAESYAARLKRNGLDLTAVEIKDEPK